MTKLFILSFLCIGVAIGNGCGATTNCTLEARSSVVVTVLDAADQSAVEGANVTYSVDGGEFEDCEEFSGDYVCGYEVAGTFIVRASHASFTVTDEGRATVGEDECHVITETLTLTISE